MKSYIELNTAARAKATTDFQKNLYKLLNNAVFGKSMENIKERIDIKFCTGEQKYTKLVSRFNFKRGFKFNDDLYAVEMQKTRAVLDKPIYVGATILELDV